MTIAPAELVNTRRAPRRSRRGALAVIAAGAVLAGTLSTNWLADSPTIATPVEPGQTVAADGNPVSLTPMSSPITADGSSSPIGLALDRITIATGAATGLKIDGAWIDSSDGATAFPSTADAPEAATDSPQLYAGFYYPIHAGPCTPDELFSQGSLATVSDGGGAICTALDQNVSGSLVVLGYLMLTDSQMSGYLQVGADDSTATSGCGSSGTTWCAPQSVVSSGSEVGYIAVTAKTPKGDIAEPQVPGLQQLQFTFAANAAAAVGTTQEGN